MPKPAVKQLTAWSFSRFMDYISCPAKAKYKHIDKLKEPPNAAMERGSAIHKMAEDYTNGALKKLPAELKLFEAEFKKLASQKVKMVEESWTYKPDWTQTTWNDWNGAWLRAKLDAAYINVEHNALVVIDHKTGKFRPEKNEEYLLQLDLYGTVGLTQHPTVDVVSPRLWYLDHGRVYPDPEQGEEELEYFRKDADKLRKRWVQRVKPMMTDTTFKPTPGAACTYCHFRKSNNGPCQY
jgi:CRISPR/Cas system-associated exonuclease Cas4 (RecB family)